MRTSEKPIVLDDSGSIRVRLRINRKSEYDVEYRYRKEYFIKAVCNPGKAAFSASILVPAKGMKKGNEGTVLASTSWDGRSFVTKEDKGDDEEEDDDSVGFEVSAMTKSMKRKLSTTLPPPVSAGNVGGLSEVILMPPSKRVKLHEVGGHSTEDEEEEVYISPTSTSLTEQLVSLQSNINASILSITTPMPLASTIGGGGGSGALILKPEYIAEIEALQQTIKAHTSELMMQQIEATRKFETEQRFLLQRWKELMDLMDSHTRLIRARIQAAAVESSVVPTTPP
jgi:hypothetical protein